MTNSTDHQRIVIEENIVWGPAIEVPLEQLAAVESILKKHKIYYWVDPDALSINGSPEFTFVCFGRNANLDEIQRILDSAK